MHRLDRRIQILRGKRNGAFDHDQYYVERALRARIARKVRLALRRMQPVVLLTPRWSEAQPFLDDVALDIKLGRPSVLSRTMSLMPMSSRPINDSWRFLLTGIMEFCHLHGHVKAVVADRNGFRNHLLDLFKRGNAGPKRALLVHGVEHMPFEAIKDLVEIFGEYCEAVGEDRRLNLLLSCPVDSPSIELCGAARMVLPDFAPAEAVDNLVEYMGPIEQAKLEGALEVVGGVPALLRAVGSTGASTGALAVGRASIWRALGSLADEIRGALDIVASDERLAKRLEQVALDGPTKLNEEAGDLELVRAGLVQRTSWGRPNRVEVRAPVFGELDLGQ